MTVSVNGIAHIHLTVRDPAQCVPFWEQLCHFLEMQTLIKGDDVIYCIGSRTGILVRGAPLDKRATRFDQDQAGLHHLCFRARSREDVDAIHRFAADTLHARIIHPPEEGSQFAPGYYSVLFEDPDGIRVEVNHVPGKGHFGPGGRLGPGGGGPATRYGSGGLEGGPGSAGGGSAVGASLCRGRSIKTRTRVAARPSVRRLAPAGGRAARAPRADMIQASHLALVRICRHRLGRGEEEGDRDRPGTDGVAGVAR